MVVPGGMGPTMNARADGPVDTVANDAWAGTSCGIAMVCGPAGSSSSGQVPDRAVRAQHRVSQLRQLIGPRGQARVEIHPEPGQLRSGPTSPASFSKLSITAFAAITGSLASAHDHAKAVLAHRDTPDKSVKPSDQEPQRLNNKLRACLETSACQAVCLTRKAARSGERSPGQGTAFERACVTSSPLAEHDAVAVGGPQGHLPTAPWLVRWRLQHLGLLRQGARVVAVNSFDRQVCDVAMVAKLRRWDCIWAAPEHEGHIPGCAEGPVTWIRLSHVATEHISKPCGRTVKIPDS